MDRSIVQPSTRYMVQLVEITADPVYSFVDSAGKEIEFLQISGRFNSV